MSTVSYKSVDLKELDLATFTDSELVRHVEYYLTLHKPIPHTWLWLLVRRLRALAA